LPAFIFRQLTAQNAGCRGEGRKWDPSGGLRLAPETIAKRFPADERHRIPELANSFAGIMHRQDVRVLEPSGECDEEIGLSHYRRNLRLYGRLSSRQYRYLRKPSLSCTPDNTTNCKVSARWHPSVTINGGIRLSAELARTPKVP
jgi:hypothetical protein